MVSRVAGFSMNKITFFVLLFLLAGCAPKEEVECNGDAAKLAVVSMLRSELTKKITHGLTDQSSTVEATPDSGMIRAVAEKIAIAISDVVTTKSDPNSTKKFCRGTLKLTADSDTIADANETRSMLSQSNVVQSALRDGLDFDANTITTSLDYNVQPTDDGKKIFVSAEGTGLSSLDFTSTLLQQSMLKGPLQRAKVITEQRLQEQALAAKQKADELAAAVQRQQAEIAEAQAAEALAKLQKATADLKSANDALNLVWNAGSKQWRAALLPEQRLWLAQRENECKIKALDQGAVDTTTFQSGKLFCQIQMTDERTQALKVSLQNNSIQRPDMDSQSLSSTAGGGTYQTSFDCRKASSDAEHLICTDPQLASADVELAQIYARAKMSVVDQVGFRDRTVRQWTYREQYCHDRTCVARWYADQKTALTEISRTGRMD
jgi:uncharacterized protein YecT (DUF1311 family)